MLKEQKRGQGKLALVEEEGGANTREARTLKDVAKFWKFNLSPMLRSLRKDHGAKPSRSDFGGRNIFWLNITP